MKKIVALFDGFCYGSISGCFVVAALKARKLPLLLPLNPRLPSLRPPMARSTRALS